MGNLQKKFQRFSIFRSALNRGTQNGPFLLGHPAVHTQVTDLMQKAVFHNLKHKFLNRIIITRVQADISSVKKSTNKRTSAEKTNSGS